jgi:hypothetical protein
VVDNIKLLGATINANFNSITVNFDNIITKIRSLIQFWDRFRLSLPGRVIIAKTFLLSQLNYLGSVFEPTAEQLELCQGLINNFIRKNLKISDCRIYLPPENGGVGFFNIQDFLDSQRCTWLFRAKKWCIDNWRHDLHTLSPNFDPLLLRSSDINRDLHPVLLGIVKAFERFYSFFSRTRKKFSTKFRVREFKFFGSGYR